MLQQLFFTNHPGETLDRLVNEIKPAGLYIITDSNVQEAVLPRLKAMSSVLGQARVIETQPGDVNKNIDALSRIWLQLNNMGATRKSLIINLGGGVVTDMGGFAASTFKRGVRFINIPTSLLAAVDASVGGKTGINFNGCKNEVGAFCDADAVIISTLFFNTLPSSELLSGYAEMLKHGLLQSRATFADLLSFDIASGTSDDDRLLELLRESVAVKEKIVAEDPHEKGIRRALNLGHTVGHAFESFAMNERRSPVPHGYAVAWGMVVELILSHLIMKFPTELLNAYAAYVRSCYGAFYITCDDYPMLLSLMSHDKKNDVADRINFTMLSDAGEVHIDRIVDREQIVAALDIYRDLMGI